MTMPPYGSDEPGSWMEIQDVFHIAGRGTVVTGQLQGTAPLNVGDIMVCDDARFEVSGIEAFRALLTTAEPGANIGVLLRNGPPGEMLRERVVIFEPGGRSPGASSPGASSSAAPKPPRRRLWRRS